MYGQGDDELDELELDELLDRERAECVLNFLWNESPDSALNSFFSKTFQSLMVLSVVKSEQEMSWKWIIRELWT